MQFFSMHSLHTTSYTRTWDTTCTRQQKAHLSVNSCFFHFWEEETEFEEGQSKTWVGVSKLMVCRTQRGEYNTTIDSPWLMADI